MTAAGGASVECRGVVHVYQVSGVDTAALRGVDFTVRPGESLSLFGPSGSGKSTLLAVLAGIRQPSAGAVSIDGVDIARASERVLRRYRRETAGVLLQNASTNLFSYGSALDNVSYARRTGDSGAATSVTDLLEVVGLTRRERTRPVAQLSRGKQQGVALATAMANEPRLLLADEPTSELRPDEAQRLIENLLVLSGALHTTVIAVTHDPGVAAAMQRTLHLRDGRIGSEATTTAGQTEQLAVVAADGSIQLPDRIFADWPPGTRAEVVAIGDDVVQLRRVRD